MDFTGIQLQSVRPEVIILSYLILTQYSKSLYKSIIELKKLSLFKLLLLINIKNDCFLLLMKSG